MWFFYALIVGGQTAECVHRQWSLRISETPLSWALHVGRRVCDKFSIALGSGPDGCQWLQPAGSLETQNVRVVGRSRLALPIQPRPPLSPFFFNRYQDLLLARLIAGDHRQAWRQKGINGFRVSPVIFESKIIQSQLYHNRKTEWSSLHDITIIIIIIIILVTI